MKKIFSVFFFAILLCRPVFSESPLEEVSDDKLRRLEILHENAEELVLRNQFRPALDVYSEIVLLEPDDETAYANMGHIYLILGDYGRAETAFKNALDINPDNDTAKLGLQKIKNPDGIPEETFGASLQKTAEEKTPASGAAAPVQSAVTVPANPADAAQPAPAIPEIVNSPASASPSLQDIQQALKNAGLYQGPIDGKLGPQSRNAIRDFQKIHGLAADGIVGPKTWSVLRPYAIFNGKTAGSEPKTED